VDEIRAGQGRFGPIVDGYVIPADPYTIFKAGKQNDVPVIAGSTANEGGVRRISSNAESAMRQARAMYGENADAYLKFFPAGTDAEAETSGYAVAADRTAVGQRAWVRLENRNRKKQSLPLPVQPCAAFSARRAFPRSSH
jgi:para-nitrobenzyl esterase